MKNNPPIESILGKLSRLLYGYNYQVFLRWYSAPCSSTQACAERILGTDAEVGGCCQVTVQELLAEIEESLRHAGDAAYGPDPSAIKSETFRELLDALRSHLLQALSSATRIEQFWLKEGHPAYPVYWDFAFMIAGPDGADVFIGSSSD